MEMIKWFEIAFLCGIGVVMGAMAGVSLLGILMEKAAKVWMEGEKRNENRN